MKTHIKLFALFLTVVFCTPCKGQNKPDAPTGYYKPEIKDTITSYGPAAITRTIKQDREGNIWLAAFDGVFRYDGKSFTNMTSKVSSARFFSVLEDRKGNFWFSSIGSGVYYYDPKRADGKTFQNFTTQQGLADNSVTHIYEDKTGNIWFGSLGGASRYDPRRADGKSFQNYKMNGGLPNTDPDDNDVNAIIEDKTGKFWLATRGNTYTYDGKTFTVFTNKGEPFTNVRTIIEDKKGNIWLAGRDGLWRYDGSIFTNFTLDFVGYVYEDKNGNIWTSSQPAYSGSGRWALSRYDAQSLSNQKPTVTEILSEYENYKGMIFGILEARDGSIWFGALDGVYRYDGNTITGFKDK